MALYQFPRRNKEWYTKAFFWLLEVSIRNTYVEDGCLLGCRAVMTLMMEAVQTSETLVNS
jgi:hypothetical protein